jgi:hypothetical protein
MQKHVVPAAFAAVLSATNLAAAQSPAATAAPTATSSSAGLAGGTLSLSAGIDYSTGKYGDTASTDILYLPFAAKYERDKWVLKLTVPFIRVTGPGNVVRDVGVVAGKPAGARETEQGLGDIVLGISRNVYDGTGSGTLIDLTGKVKFGTASFDKGLGTGENDYAAQIDLTQRVLPLFTAFGSLGYKFVGNPSGADLHNAAYVEGGGSYKIADATSAGLILFLSEAQSPSGPQRELTAFASQQLAERWKLLAYVVHGFANGSPDWGGGGVVTFKF